MSKKKSVQKDDAEVVLGDDEPVVNAEEPKSATKITK